VLGTPEGDWVSMGVAVDGQYGIDKGIICGLPCVAKNGQWSVVEGLELDAFSKPRIDASVAELREEYDAVKELGLI
jgi:malate dehydrogenase